MGITSPLLFCHKKFNNPMPLTMSCSVPEYSQEINSILSLLDLSITVSSAIIMPSLFKERTSVLAASQMSFGWHLVSASHREIASWESFVGETSERVTAEYLWHVTCKKLQYKSFEQRYFFIYPVYQTGTVNAKLVSDVELFYLLNHLYNQYMANCQNRTKYKRNKSGPRPPKVAR